jgi:hypothetical protein
VRLHQPPDVGALEHFPRRCPDDIGHGDSLDSARGTSQLPARADRLAERDDE